MQSNFLLVSVPHSCGHGVGQGRVSITGAVASSAHACSALISSWHSGPAFLKSLSQLGTQSSVGREHAVKLITQRSMQACMPSMGGPASPEPLGFVFSGLPHAMVAVTTGTTANKSRRSMKRPPKRNQRRIRRSLERHTADSPVRQGQRTSIFAYDKPLPLVMTVIPWG